MLRTSVSQVLAQFRRELTTGLSESASVLQASGLDPALLAFSMWTETLRDAAREGRGNVLFLDGNVATMEDALRRMQELSVHPTSPPPAQ